MCLCQFDGRQFAIKATNLTNIIPNLCYGPTNKSLKNPQLPATYIAIDVGNDSDHTNSHNNGTNALPFVPQTVHIRSENKATKSTDSKTTIATDTTTIASTAINTAVTATATTAAAAATPSSAPANGNGENIVRDIGPLGTGNGSGFGGIYGESSNAQTQANAIDNATTTVHNSLPGRGVSLSSSTVVRRSNVWRKWTIDRLDQHQRPQQHAHHHQQQQQPQRGPPVSTDTTPATDATTSVAIANDDTIGNDAPFSGWLDGLGADALVSYDTSAITSLPYDNKDIVDGSHIYGATGNNSIDGRSASHRTPANATIGIFKDVSAEIDTNGDTGTTATATTTPSSSSAVSSLSSPATATTTTTPTSTTTDVTAGVATASVRIIHIQSEMVLGNGDIGPSLGGDLNVAIDKGEQQALFLNGGISLFVFLVLLAIMGKFCFGRMWSRLRRRQRAQRKVASRQARETITISGVPPRDGDCLVASSRPKYPANDKSNKTKMTTTTTVYYSNEELGGQYEPVYENRFYQNLNGPRIGGDGCGGIGGRAGGGNTSITTHQPIYTCKYNPKTSSFFTIDRAIQFNNGVNTIERKPNS